MAREARVVILLRSGGSVTGKYATMTEEEFDQAADVLGEVMARSDSWRLTIDRSLGAKALVPKDSVDYVSLEWKPEDVF